MRNNEGQVKKELKLLLKTNQSWTVILVPNDNLLHIKNPDFNEQISSSKAFCFNLVWLYKVFKVSFEELVL